MKPIDVTKENESEVRRIAYSYVYELEKKPRFSVGDFVRISLHHPIFKKAYEAYNFSSEVFKVASVNLCKPVTYKLINETNDPVESIFYESELVRVDDRVKDFFLIDKVVRKRKNDMLVKVQGRKDHYIWIPISDAFDLRHS
jgi:hypothetical protein